VTQKEFFGSEVFRNTLIKDFQTGRAESRDLRKIQVFEVFVNIFMKNIIRIEEYPGGLDTVAIVFNRDGLYRKTLATGLGERGNKG
jgi:hypothetical protein